ncbi:hypothetical protein ACFYVL_01315 [Streptomyces sp. NPDC004111]|uniref:hypothetical protein n=1 Tax=Streptomyces sp. NPDC004111 TaxID=3364690 RepID=UPI00368BBF1C
MSKEERPWNRRQPEQGPLPRPPETNRLGPRPASSVAGFTFLIVITVWTLLAWQWTDRGCHFPKVYVLVLSHGTPDDFHQEGCNDEFDDTYPIDLS